MVTERVLDPFSELCQGNATQKAFVCRFFFKIEVSFCQYCVNSNCWGLFFVCLEFFTICFCKECGLGGWLRSWLHLLCCWHCCLHVWNNITPQSVLALSNHFNSCTTINTGPDLSLLTTFIICLNSWLTRCKTSKIAQHSQTVLLRTARRFCFQ